MIVITWTLGPDGVALAVEGPPLLTELRQKHNIENTVGKGTLNVVPVDATGDGHRIYMLHTYLHTHLHTYATTTTAKTNVPRLPVSKGSSEGGNLAEPQCNGQLTSSEARNSAQHVLLEVTLVVSLLRDELASQ